MTVSDTPRARCVLGPALIEPAKSPGAPDSPLPAGPASTAPVRIEDIAWLIVQSVRDDLRRTDRTRVFTQLGAGEPLVAIETVLAALARRRQNLFAAGADAFGRWLDLSTGHEDEPRLRALLAIVRGD